MKNSIKQIFKRGLITLTPIALSLVIIIWIFRTFEKFLKPFVEIIVGKKFYFPGLGFIFAIILIFFIGLIINTWLAKKFYNFGDRILNKNQARNLACFSGELVL